MSYIKIDIIRRIDRWYIVTDGRRFGFAWGVKDNKVSEETDLDGESGVVWYDSRQEAETELLDSLEELYEEGMSIMPEPLLDTSDVAGFIRGKTGKNWDRRYVSQYRRQDAKFPAPDETIGNRPYWYQSTIEKYLEGKRWYNGDQPSAPKQK